MHLLLLVQVLVRDDEMPRSSVAKLKGESILSSHSFPIDVNIPAFPSRRRRAIENRTVFFFIINEDMHDEERHHRQIC